MANTLNLITKYSPLQDKIYKLASKTAFLDSITETIPNAGANVIKIMKASVVGSGNYSTSTGYPKGNASITWETIQLILDRGRQITIDRVANEEMENRGFAAAVGAYMGNQVVPELDAMRFARWAAAAGSSTTGSLTNSNVIAALDTAQAALDTGETPEEGRICFLSSPTWRSLNQALNRAWSNEQRLETRVLDLDGTTYIPVPQARFYTAVTLDAGATEGAGGFSSNGSDLNFLLLHPTAIWQSVKFEKMKIFSPDVYQDGDDWVAQFRQYHDADVFDNKTDGVYYNSKA